MKTIKNVTFICIHISTGSFLHFDKAQNNSSAQRPFVFAFLPPSPSREQMFDSRQFALKSVNGGHEHNTLV